MSDVRRSQRHAAKERHRCTLDVEGRSMENIGQRNTLDSACTSMPTMGISMKNIDGTRQYMYEHANYRNDCRGMLQVMYQRR